MESTSTESTTTEKIILTTILPTTNNSTANNSTAYDVLEECMVMCHDRYSQISSRESCNLGCEIAYSGYTCNYCGESFTISGYRKCEFGCSYYSDRQPTNSSYVSIFFPDCINVMGLNYVLYNGIYNKSTELFNNHPIYYGPRFSIEGTLIQRGVIFYNYMNGYTLGPQTYNQETNVWSSPVHSYVYHLSLIHI